MLTAFPVPVQVSWAFRAWVDEDGRILAALERSDLQENATAYAAQLSGDAQATVARFANVSEALSFNTSQHGLCYSVGLLVKVGHTWSKPVRSVPVLTSKNQ